MSSDVTTATRTYLEMISPAALRPAPAATEELAISPVAAPTADLWRYLYTEVGRAHRWFDRLSWTDEEAQSYLDDPAIDLWVATAGGRTAGYFELRREPEGSIEIVYFGLLPAYTGRGLGGRLLTEAVVRAWASGATRVWVHTCSFDHPAAIPNYLRRGFTIFRIEQYTVR